MTDIIQDAKELVESTPIGPDGWECELMPGYGYCVVDPGRHLVGDFYSREDYALMAAAAPELAQALAEETWEYAVQAKAGSKWEYRQDGFFRDAWFSELQKAKAGAKELRSIGKETRIVRRRVSLPEVINE